MTKEDALAADKFAQHSNLDAIVRDRLRGCFLAGIKWRDENPAPAVDAAGRLSPPPTYEKAVSEWIARNVDPSGTISTGAVLRSRYRKCFLAGADWQSEQERGKIEDLANAGEQSGCVSMPMARFEELRRDHEAMEILRAKGYHVWLSHDALWHAQGGTIDTAWDDPAKAIVELKAMLDEQAKTSQAKEESKIEKAFRIVTETGWCAKRFGFKYWTVVNLPTGQILTSRVPGKDGKIGHFAEETPEDALIAAYSELKEIKS